MLSVAYLFHWNIIIFQDISHAHRQICLILAWVKLHHDRHQGLAFASIHEQPFHFLIMFQDEKNTWICSEIILKNTDTSVE